MKLKCIKSYKSGELCTSGNIYEVGEDGKITWDDGYRSTFGKGWKINGRPHEDFFVDVKEEERVKFKVGDRVKVDGNTWRIEFNGEIGTIIDIVDAFPPIAVKFDKYRRVFHTCGRLTENGFGDYVEEKNLTLLKPSYNSIHITTKDNTVHAVLKSGDTVIKRAKATCCPSDTFSFEYGANLAMQRLMDTKVDLTNVDTKDLLAEIEKRCK